MPSRRRTTRSPTRFCVSPSERYCLGWSRPRWPTAGAPGGGAPLRRPAPLRPGDTVAVIAPSGQVDPDRLRLGGKVLESFGLTGELGEHVLHRTGRYPACTYA